MPNNALSGLIENNKSFSIAPAGCGKTETVVDLGLSEYENHGKQLILTHTHAGVHSIRRRLISKNRLAKIAYINTIDSFCLEWVYAYPKLSNLDIRNSDNYDWGKIRQAFLYLVKNIHIKQVIRLKWQGLIVDEYQDCDIHQHKIILALSDVLPTRILGDPLQGIFDFSNTENFNWDSDVATNYTQVPFDITPIRWANSSPDLGKWLLDKRFELISQNKISLTDLPNSVKIIRPNFRDNLRLCSIGINTYPDDSHLIIHHQPPMCHNVSRSLAGTYRSIEELEFNDLKTFADKFDNSADNELHNLVITTLSEIAVGMTRQRIEIISQLRNGKTLLNKEYLADRGIFDELAQISKENNISAILKFCNLASNLSKYKVFRMEFYRLMIEALNKLNSGLHASMKEATESVVNQYRYAGRFNDRRTVGRIRLVKGLDYDHVYIFDLDKFKDPREVYVALTRAKKTLTIISNTNILNYSTFSFPSVIN